MSVVAIFTDKGTYHELAYIWPHSAGWEILPSAYAEAADQLVAAAAGAARDLLVYPIVFLYRHAIELGLKELIRAALQVQDDGGGEVPRHHDLAKLWQRASALLTTIAPEDSEGGREEVGAIIMELHELDERGTSFRYDEKIGDKLQGAVNLREIGKTMQVVLTWLSGGVDMLGEWQSASDHHDGP